jgi:hypothetical protein
VEYFPQIGYLVAINDDANNLMQIFRDAVDEEVASRFSFVYKHANNCYFKHPIVQGKFYQLFLSLSNLFCSFTIC